MIIIDCDRACQSARFFFVFRKVFFVFKFLSFQSSVFSREVIARRTHVRKSSAEAVDRLAKQSSYFSVVAILAKSYAACCSDCAAEERVE